MLYGIHVITHLVILPLLLGVLYWVRNSSDSEAASWMSVLLVADFAWVLMFLVALLFPPSGKQLWYPITTAFATLVPIPWVVFTLYYTGREEWLTRPVWAGLCVTHGLGAAIVATNSVHGLVFSELELVAEPFVHVVAQETTLQWLISVIPMASTVVGIALLIDFMLSTKHLSQAQSLAIVGGAGAATVINLVWILGVGPAPGFNYSGIAAGIFAGSIGWALFNDDLFRVAPVARDAVFASFSDPLIAVDATGTVVDFNEAATEVFPDISSSLGKPLRGLEPELFKADSSAVEFVADSADQRAADSADSADQRAADGAGELAADEISLFETEMVSEAAADSFETTVDGKPLSFRLNTSPIVAGNKQVGVVFHLRDVTELERQTAELERRTDQLETKSQQLEQFASSVSHDLRNPINVAQGRIELTKETGNLDHLDHADDAMDRGLATIEELLDLAKSGQTIGDPEQVELTAVVEAAWETVDTAAATLVTDLMGMTVAADRGRLQGLFENLFRNAVEHGSTSPQSQAPEDAVEHGGTDLTVTVGKAEDGFFVADDGPGIPAEEREKVFDHGYTGSDGTGLGLAKVEAIAVAHDWTVSAEASDAGGAQFSFGNVSSEE